jgi:hypothetical protein
MDLKLVVLKPDRWKNKVISVTGSPFLIGRDPECHLRASSRLVSQRQCALVTREGRAFVQDLNTTNGTFVNERQIKGEIELLDGDRLQVRPLVLEVRIGSDTTVDRPTPLPASKNRSVEDEAAAALLTSLQEDEQQRSTENVDNPPSQTTFREIKTSVTPIVPASQPRPEPFGSVSSARDILKKMKKKRRDR